MTPPPGPDDQGAAVTAARSDEEVLGDGHHDTRGFARVVVCLQDRVGAREQLDPPLGSDRVMRLRHDGVADQLDEQVSGAAAAGDAAGTVGHDHHQTRPVF
jgi:hypothetical protein